MSLPRRSMSRSTITTKGQTTVPKDVRVHLGVGPGDKVAYARLEDGTVLLSPVRRSVTELKGMFRHRGRRITLAAMERAIAAGRGRKAKPR